MRRSPGLLAVGAVALLVACSSSSGSSSGPDLPPAAERIAFSYVTNLIPVTVTVSGVTAEGFVDTGDPFVELDPQTFPAAESLSGNGGDLSSITIGAQPVSNPYVLPSSAGLTSPDPAFPIGANVGCTGICAFVAAFDYRGATFSLAAAAPTPPSGLEPETTFPFSFEGGSVLDGVNVPRSRIVLQVSLEGTMYAMILDTGASSVTVSQAAFSALTADGRVQITGGSTETTGGTSTSSLTRAASIAVGGVTVDSVVVAHDTAFDTNLAAISTDVGKTIDGSLGGDFLHDFFVTIDYPASTVHLARYSDLSWAIDQGEQIGLALQASGSSYTVAGASPAVAAMGVYAGDVVESIDGVQLSGLSLAQEALLLFGPVGATKSVHFGAAAQVANQTLTMTVEEFLPLK